MNLCPIDVLRRAAGQPMGEAKVVEKIGEICAEYPRYGYRRVTAQLRQRGLRGEPQEGDEDHARAGPQRAATPPLCGHDRQQSRRADLSKPRQGLMPTGPNQLWVADLTYIAIARGFVYLAVILDAWSRRVVGYAVGLPWTPG